MKNPKEEAKQRAKNYMSLKGALDSQYVDFSNPNADKITSASTTTIKEEPKQIKCYCGHTDFCDCSPLEEPKQETHICKWCKAETWQSDDECYAKPETLEEFIKVELEGYDEIDFSTYERFIKLGAKWQQKRMYSEEEVIVLLQKYRLDLSSGKTPNLGDTTKQWLEQFKKK